VRPGQVESAATGAAAGRAGEEKQEEADGDRFPGGDGAANNELQLTVIPEPNTVGLVGSSRSPCSAAGRGSNDKDLRPEKERSKLTVMSREPGFGVQIGTPGRLESNESRTRTRTTTRTRGIAPALRHQVPGVRFQEGQQANGQLLPA
jgi:hypothetical protein